MAQQKRKLEQAVSTEIVPVVVPSEPLPPSSTDIIKIRLATLAGFIVAVFVVFVLAVALLGHWALTLDSTTWLVKVISYTIGGTLIAAVLLALFAGYTYIDSRLKDKASERRMAEERHSTEMYIVRTRLLPNEAGNYPHVWDEQEKRTIVTPVGQYIPNVPEHWAPHEHHEYNYRDTSTRVTEEQEEQKQLPGIAAPSMDYIISQVPYNSLQVCLGVSATTGEPFTMDLIEGTHYRIIGGSGFGVPGQSY